MDVVSAVSAGVGLIGTLGGLWFALRAENRARAADLRATEAHTMARAAHRMVRSRHLRDEAELERAAFVSELVEQVYRRAADPYGAGLTGIALNADLPPEGRAAALSLKGDPRVADVTVDADGTIRVWVDGSGYPSMPQ